MIPRSRNVNIVVKLFILIFYQYYVSVSNDFQTNQWKCLSVFMLVTTLAKWCCCFFWRGRSLPFFSYPSSHPTNLPGHGLFVLCISAWVLARYNIIPLIYLNSDINNSNIILFNFRWILWNVAMLAFLYQSLYEIINDSLW